MKGVSVVIQRSLRDLLHQVPSTEVAIKVINIVVIGMIFQELIVVYFVNLRWLQFM